MSTRHILTQAKQFHFQKQKRKKKKQSCFSRFVDTLMKRNNNNSQFQICFKMQSLILNLLFYLFMKHTFHKQIM